MEPANLRDCKKRVREGDEDQMIRKEKHAKTKNHGLDLDGVFDIENGMLEYKYNYKIGSSSDVTVNSCCKSSSSDSHDYCDLAFGVFDFPWLKDGIISKSDQDDYWNFEDVFFSSPLEYEYDQIHIHPSTLSSNPAGARIEFSNFSWQCFCDETDADKKEEDKLKLDQQGDGSTELKVHN